MHIQKFLMLRYAFIENSVISIQEYFRIFYKYVLYHLYNIKRTTALDP